MMLILSMPWIPENATITSTALLSLTPVIAQCLEQISFFRWLGKFPYRA